MRQPRLVVDELMAMWTGFTSDDSVELTSDLVLDEVRIVLADVARIAHPAARPWRRRGAWPSRRLCIGTSARSRGSEQTGLPASRGRCSSSCRAAGASGEPGEPGSPPADRWCRSRVSLIG